MCTSVQCLREKFVTCTSNKVQWDRGRKVGAVSGNPRSSS